MHRRRFDRCRRSTLLLEPVNLAAFNNSKFDRGASAWKEALWCSVRILFFQTRWPFPSRLRVSWLRAFGALIGDGAVIRSGVNISFPWRLIMGHNVWLGEDVGILSLAQVTIGSNVCISQRAFLCTGSHDFRREDFALKTAPITIGDEVWIAASAFIAPGVVIGRGALIAAGAVVFNSVPDGARMFGNPASARPLTIAQQ